MKVKCHHLKIYSNEKITKSNYRVFQNEKSSWFRKIPHVRSAIWHCLIKELGASPELPLSNEGQSLI